MMDTITSALGKAMKRAIATLDPQRIIDRLFDDLLRLWQLDDL